MDSVEQRIAAAQDTASSGHALSVLARDSDPDVRAYAAANPSLPLASLLELRHDPEVLPRRGAALNPNATAELLECLAKDTWAVQQAVASNPGTPVAILRAFAADMADSDVTQYMIGTLDSGEVGFVLTPEAQVRIGLAYNRRLPDDLIRTLAVDEVREVRQAMASNQSTPAEVLATLAADESSEVRQAVAFNPSASFSTRRTLAANETDATVDWALALNPLTPSDALEQILNRRSGMDATEVRLRRDLAMNPTAPVEVLRRLATDPDVQTRVNVAGNPNAGVSLIRGLRTDPEFSVRLAAERNESAVTDDLMTALVSEEAEVRAATREQYFEAARSLERVKSLREELSERGVVVQQSLPALPRKPSRDPVDSCFLVVMAVVVLSLVIPVVVFVGVLVWAFISAMLEG